LESCRAADLWLHASQVTQGDVDCHVAASGLLADNEIKEHYCSVMSKEAYSQARSTDIAWPMSVLDCIMLREMASFVLDLGQCLLSQTVVVVPNN
jgi:hypothetical protein